MALWGNTVFASGNQKPKFANTANVIGANTSRSSAVGLGISPGWVERTIGTGYVKEIGILGSNTGANYNANGFITFTGGGGTGANASFTYNAVTNTIATITLNSGGSGYSNTPTAGANVANTTRALFYVRLGGRADRNTYETLAYVKSMSGDTL
jgi:hypothetical protein